MNFKNIVFNTWSGAFFQKGGGEVQLLQSKLALEKRGHHVQFFDMWNPQLDIDILHQFSIQAGVEHVVKRYKNGGHKVALSTIMWDLHPRDYFEYHRIRSIMSDADILLTNSEAESVRLADHFQMDLSKFHKTRNSIGDSFFGPAQPEIFRKKYGIEGDFILSVANIDRRKNFEKLIPACKELGVRIVGIGHLQDKEYFESFKNLYKDYIYLGPMDNEEMLKSAYAACSVYALPSLCETPGIAALEAASQGAKIVITNEGCAEEYFGNKAEYVNPHDLSSIVQGLEKAMNAPKDSELPEFIRKNYSWDITAKEIIEGYEKIKTLQS